MEAWQQAFAQMKEQFMVKSMQRLEQIDTLIGALDQIPSDLDVMRQVMRHFHWLAGSGGTYDMPTITDVGGYGEKFCDDIINSKAIFQDDDRKHLRMLVESARVILLGQNVDKPDLPPLNDTIMTPIELDVILIEDDDKSSRELTNLLEQEGLLVRDHKSIFAAQRAIRERIPKGLIISLKVIDNTVFETIEKLRSLPEGADTVIVLIEKVRGLANRTRAAFAGVDKIIDTQVSWPDMINHFRRVIDSKRPEPYKVLSVEDDPDQSTYIRAVLQSIGCNVESIMDPKLFPQTLEAFNPDLLLLDIMLGEMTGFDLAKYVRKTKTFSSVPIIFLSTQTHIESKIHAHKLGAEEFLPKPVSRERLAAAVATKAERSRRKKAEKRRDGLTEIATFSTWMQELMTLQTRDERGIDRKLVLLILDIDDFSRVNEGLGFAAGDMLLVSLAQLLNRRLRTAVIGRHGPDSIAAVIEDLSEQETVQLTKMLLDKFSSIEHKAESGVGFYATCSAGIVPMPHQNFTVQGWLAATNILLAKAKELGRSSIASPTIANQAANL
jgi:diguanylate cyclase (GGDEF)-like protein